MGQAVIAQGNHNLDISSIEALANDVSKRFRANVSYGYYDQYWWDINGIEIEPSYEHIEFGYKPFANAKETIQLSDELYQVKQLVNKHGTNTLNLPCFRGSKSMQPEIDAAIKGVHFAIRNNEKHFEYGNLFNSTFQDDYNCFGTKWWNFCRTFMDDENDWINTFDDINDYRQQVKELFDKVGTTEAVYIGDQGEIGFLTSDYLNWEEIMQALKTTYKDKMLNISEFMKHKTPIPKDQYPLAFYDDFADLT